MSFVWFLTKTSDLTCAMMVPVIVIICPDDPDIWYWILGRIYSNQNVNIHIDQFRKKHLAVYKRRIDEFDVLFPLLLSLLFLQKDAMESNIESNVVDEEECRDHDVEEHTGENDEHSVSNGGPNRGKGGAGKEQSKNSVMENQESFDKSTPPLPDSMKKKAPEDKGRNEKDQVEVVL